MNVLRRRPVLVTLLLAMMYVLGSAPAPAQASTPVPLEAIRMTTEILPAPWAPHGYVAMFQVDNTSQQNAELSACVEETHQCFSGTVSPGTSIRGQLTEPLHGTIGFSADGQPTGTIGYNFTTVPQPYRLAFQLENRNGVWVFNALIENFGPAGDFVIRHRQDSGFTIPAYLERGQNKWASAAHPVTGEVEFVRKEMTGDGHPWDNYLGNFYYR
jgi:hypothetical protein